jgi:hypothetical protein
VSKIDFRPLCSGYGEIAGHQRRLLDDEVRTGAFLTAIARQVKAGDVVADLGAGTGVLSLAAARAGARRVHAIEVKPTARLLGAIAGDNGVGEIVVPHERHSRDVVLPEALDVLVSECIGVLAIGGTMIQAVTELRERALRPHGVVIPRAIGVWLAPCESAPCRAYLEAWRARHGFDFSRLGALARNNLYSAAIEPHELLGPGAEVIALDLGRGRHDGRASGRVALRVERDGVLDGLCGWFVADLGAGVGLSTAPGMAETVWRQVFLPAPESVAVSRGTIVTAELSSAPGSAGDPVELSWAIGIGDRPAARQSTAMSYP